jgi:hypothetical protein
MLDLVPVTGIRSRRHSISDFSHLSLHVILAFTLLALRSFHMRHPQLPLTAPQDHPHNPGFSMGSSRR